MVKVFDFFWLVLYCAFIFWLSSQSRLPPPPDWLEFDFQDKFQHFGAYAVMSILAWRSFKHWISIAIILALVSVVFCSLYGVSDEWHQSFVEGRTSELFDWLADTVGACAGVFFCYWRSKVE